MAPFNEPNVEQATKSGIIHANMPNIFVANVTWKIGQIDMRYAFEVKKKYHEGMKSVIMTKLTATASDEIISSDDRTAKQAIFVITYTMVTTGILMQIARGKFLNDRRYNEKLNKFC